ncbi:hypothetical protein [uncultured Duncaniella sp.]|uniref:hypothetical protein n=2 Tax=uncultured Duncaniella sp. TaxID=2768039 RepID=UPI002602D7E0|nr:hypothetical protein [uncultured Duncaniella sp.]
MNSIYIVMAIMFAGARRWSRGREPRFRTELGRISYYFSKDEAEKAIKANATLKSEESKSVYRYFLREVPAGEALYDGEYKREWVYDATGKLLDHTLCSTCHCDIHTEHYIFGGREPEQIRFSAGDIVEWYDGYGSVWLGVVVGTPYTVGRCREMYETLRRSPRFAGLSDDKITFPLDFSDDSYLIVNTENYMESHVHVSSHYVSAPTFPVPQNLLKRLASCFKNCADE